MTQRIRRQRHRTRRSSDVTDTEPAASAELQDEIQDPVQDPVQAEIEDPLQDETPDEVPDEVPDVAPIEERDPDHPEAFGRWLRSQRELRGIPLRAIADTSKIGMGYLKALESGRFDILPAEVFTKGFLRQYSGFVGLDPEEAINFYLAAREHVDEVEDPLLSPPAPKGASGIRWVLVALVLAALLIGVIWGLSRLVEKQAAGGEPIPPASSSSAAAPAAGPEAARPDGASEATDSGTTAPEPPAVQPAAQPAVPALPAVPLRVVIDFSDTCWVSALIDGSETREKVHAQGESLALSAQKSVELKVGNYRAVEVEVNGMPYDLGPRGRSGSVVRTVLIDLASLDALRGSASESTTGDTTPGGTVN